MVDAHHRSAHCAAREVVLCLLLFRSFPSRARSVAGRFAFPSWKIHQHNAVTLRARAARDSDGGEKWAVAAR